MEGELSLGTGLAIPTKPEKKSSWETQLIHTILIIR
jgi:hypothetical protein